LKPMKRRGNRRYYQHHEVLLIRRIRDLLYEQGFTISGARNRLGDGAAEALDEALDVPDADVPNSSASTRPRTNGAEPPALTATELRASLVALRTLLGA